MLLPPFFVVVSRCLAHRLEFAESSDLRVVVAVLAQNLVGVLAD
jgi:hypothetical protein